MRRLNDERGMVAVTVAILVVVFMGMGALVLDVASMYQEKRELQNGADAAALAIAENCARTPLTCIASANTIAKSYADLNALDDESALDGPVSFGTNQVTVKTSTLKPGGGTSILFSFAKVLSPEHDGQRVKAQATAKWGAADSARTLPITFSSCEFAAAMPYDHNVTLTIKSGHTNACSASKSDAPGAFGYLQPLSGEDPCAPLIKVYDSRTDNGADWPPCNLTPKLGTVVQLPIFDTVGGSGSSVTYRIVGIASFRLDGFKLSGSVSGGNSTCLFNGDLCLNGAFVRFVTYDATVTDLPVDSFGTTAISLTN
jgi:hypothetical protein